MQRPCVLYAGDTHLDGAAAYLAAMMTRWDLDYHYIPSDRAMNADDLAQNPALFVFSDYAASSVSHESQLQIVEQVEQGAGLLMIGGWESFQGSDGRWRGQPVGEILPVHIAEQDDRINCDQPTLVHCAASHAITEGLPWAQRPPTVGGFNRLVAKAEAQTLLEVKRFAARHTGPSPEDYSFTCMHSDPLLIVGQHGEGRTAALATDVAPHWVGGWVDWGLRRYPARAQTGQEVEVGDEYARFFHRLLRWTSGERVGLERDPQA